MGESAKSMIERFRNQKPLSRDERQRMNSNEGMKEMWWITEGEGEGHVRHRQQGTEDIELPRPSPIKPQLYPSSNSNIHNRHPQSKVTSVGLRDSDDEFLARVGLGRSNDERGTRGSSGNVAVSGDHEFLQPKFSREFGRTSGGRADYPHHPSIDELISEDVQYSNSIERLLNAYPKHPPSRGGSLDAERLRASGGGGAGYRLKSSLGRGSETNPSSSLDLYGADQGGTLKGLLLSLKLDGKSTAADAPTPGPRDQKEMSENLQAIIESLHCLDETTGKGGEMGPGVVADNIQQVGANLHADMRSFVLLYDEKYAKEDRADEERRLRDEKMRQEGKREQLRELQRDHCLDGQVWRTDVDDQDSDKPGSEEMKTASQPSTLSQTSAPPVTSAATAIASTEARFRAAWVGTESRPVWSSKQGKYVLPPDPTAAAAEERRKALLAQEEESLRVSPSSFRPLFSSSASPPVPAMPSCYSGGLSHGSISRAARTAIETCLNATEQTLLIRLPEEEPVEIVENLTVLEDSFQKSQSIAHTQLGHATEEEEEEEEKRKKGVEVEGNDDALETKIGDRIAESISDTLSSTAAHLSSPPVSSTSHPGCNDTTPVSSTKKKLEMLDALLGHDDDASLRFLAAYREQMNTTPLRSTSTHKSAAVQFHSLEEIDRALTSKPSLPADPVYQHYNSAEQSSIDLSLGGQVPQRLDAPSNTAVPPLRMGAGAHDNSRRVSALPNSRGALPNFLLKKAFPSNCNDNQHGQIQPTPPQSHPRVHPGGHSDRNFDEVLSRQYQQGKYRREEGTLRIPPHPLGSDGVNNSNFSHEHIISTTSNGHDSNLANNNDTFNSDDYDAGGGSARSGLTNFHDRTIFLAQMKRLRLNMSQ